MNRAYCDYFGVEREGIMSSSFWGETAESELVKARNELERLYSDLAGIVILDSVWLFQRKICIVCSVIGSITSEILN